MAERVNLDVVLVAPNAKPPVAKIMDYGKFKFEQQKKDKEARKKQKVADWIYYNEQEVFIYLIVGINLS